MSLYERLPPDAPGTLVLGIDPGSRTDRLRRVCATPDAAASTSPPAASGPVTVRCRSGCRSSIAAGARRHRPVRAGHHGHRAGVHGAQRRFGAQAGSGPGAAIVAGAEGGLEISEYTASQVKKAVVGNGGADKQQVMLMVMHLLRLTEKPQIDASDALAIALCHAHTRQSLVPMACWRPAAVAVACVSSAIRSLISLQR